MKQEPQNDQTMETSKPQSTGFSALSACELVAGYRSGQRVLDGINVTLSHGELVCILGPNGSGKSTLLRCLLGLLKPLTGSIEIEGQTITTMPPAILARQMAYVPQRTATAFAMTVREVVLTGRFAHGGVLGLATPDDIEAAQEAMHRCGVTSLSDRLMDELSGGEAQCVMIARAVAQHTRIMLLDEPTSHLDLKNQSAIYRLMRSLAHEFHQGVLCVSHDVNLAARFADRLIMMNSGQIVADGEPAKVMTKVNLEVTYETMVRLLQIDDEIVPVVMVD